MTEYSLWAIAEGRPTSELGAYLNALIADGCVFCGDPVQDFDHIVPRSRGGEDSWENRAPVCKSCNSKKGTRSLLGHLLAIGIEERFHQELASAAIARRMIQHWGNAGRPA